ncbi:MAG: hypothetical protein ABFD75_12445 [Smithella sp.]
MIENINEKCLRTLAKKIGINDSHGWKSALQKRLMQKKPSIISTWIKRGMPKEFENILAMASIDIKIWHEIIENVNNVGKTGQDEMLVDKEAGEKYKENLSEAISNHSTKKIQSTYHINTPAQPSFNDYIDHTYAILQSSSVFSTALKSNIEAFYFGLKINQDLDAAHNLLRQHAKLFQAQNQTIDNLKSKIDNLEKENKNLKNNNDNQEARIKAIEERLLAIKSA